MTIRVAFHPPVKRADPAGFLALLGAAIGRAGAERVEMGPLTPRWALTQSAVDVVHLHWLEYVAAPDPRPIRGWALSWMRVVRLLLTLTILRLRGVGVVWTIHNRAPHESVRPRPQVLLFAAVYLLADELIVHSAYAAEEVTRTFRGRRRRAPHVIPHANYLDAFPDAGESRVHIRARLGIPEDAFVYLAFVVIRRYKRLPLLAEQFSLIAGDGARLLVAGAPSQADEAARVRAAAARDPRIIVRAEYVPDDLVGALHLAADAAVIAYADVFSSGALLLALSYGLPVVAPDGGTAHELFAAPAVEFFTGEAMLPALERVRRGDRRAAARASAERFPWTRAGEDTVAVYRRAIDRPRRTARP